MYIYIHTYRERLRIFTISARVRLHTWRLGLTALILKNCHLSPDDLLFTPRASSSSCSSLSGSFNRSRHPYASPRHPSHRGAKLRRFAPFRANFSTDFSSPFRGNTLATTKNQPYGNAEGGGVGPFAGCPYEQVGIRSHEMAGICHWNFGENCLGVRSVDEGRVKKSFESLSFDEIMFNHIREK